MCITLTFKSINIIYMNTHHINMRSVLLVLFLALGGVLMAQDGDSWRVVRSLPQKHFINTMPRGNYSGIARVDDDVYALVSDKSDSALFFNVRLYISKQTGEILQAEYLGESGRADAPGLDNEAIARVSDSTVVVASEEKCRLKEYRIDGKPWEGSRKQWEWSMPTDNFWPNYSFESLAYDSLNHRLWTVNESTMRLDGKPATTSDPHNNVLRLISFDWTDRTKAPVSYLYRMDMPTTMKTAQTYTMGVSELCALPDGRLLVLEREAFVPKVKVGAFCQCKLYVVSPSVETPYPLDKKAESGAPFVHKRLLTSWRTTLTIVSQNWANYEGMCIGPRLENGDLVLILVSDSQDGYAGVLRDWFKTIVISDK